VLRFLKIQVNLSDKKIHAKVYILRPEPFNEHTPAIVITGSSNLTDAGLLICLILKRARREKLKNRC
jgi:HKD family nuclease